MQLELSIVVPMYNQAQNVPALVHETSGALRGRAFELLLVDDGSVDATLGEALRLCEELPQLRVLQLPWRRGESAALYSGVQASRGAWVATLDGDGQHDPRDIGVLLAARDAEEDERVRLVMGRRTRREDGAWRGAKSRVVNRVRTRLFGDETPDGACGLKLFARDTFLALPRFDHMHRFLPVLFARAGAGVISVAVRHRARLGCSSKEGLFNRLSAGLLDLGGVVWLGRRHLPLHDVVELGRPDRSADPRAGICPEPHADAEEAAAADGRVEDTPSGVPAVPAVPAVLAPLPRE